MTIYARFLSLSLLIFMLTACGSGQSGSGSGKAVAESKGCIAGGCHETIPSKVTGNAIGSEWKASSHYSTNVAGCVTCHGYSDSPSHQNSCGKCHGGTLLQNTSQNLLDANHRCLDCHVSAGSLMKGLDSSHIPELNPRYRLSSGFSYYSAAGYYTMRGTAYESKCIWCHNPHDNRVLPQHGQWAESGHGNKNASPFARNSIDFKTRGSAADWSQAPGDGCVRCHTASGYINLVTSSMKNISPWGLQADGKTPISFTRQTLYCNVCHDNGNDKAYGYNLRDIPAQGASGGVRVYHNLSTAISYSSTTGNCTANENCNERFTRQRIVNNSLDFPNTGISNRCILCHSGRGSGKLINIAAATKGFDNQSAINFRKINRITPHDFPGAGTMFRSLGFELYSSYHYAQPSAIPYAHDQIGQGGYAGTGSRGPCVSCHMSSGESHSFMPVSLDSTNSAITSVNTPLCSACHSLGGPGYSRFDGTVSSITAKKAGYAAALKALSAWLKQKKLNSTNNWLRTASYPASLTSDGFSQAICKPPVDRSMDIYIGSRNMGSYMNYDYFSNDPGAFVHNDLYVKRLIYDSLNWLEDCNMGTDTVEKAIRLTTNTVSGQVTVFTAPLTSAEADAAIKYLLGAPGNGRPGGM